ncbi:hypothetical protein PILCRDRAFT_1323 [Piloderma croceum F 1598]|uniref:Mug135-like C-terminal domain-containing protein n=1 Tax=Piloderma croceum (strain F 1598) TaxID=765440 RepID=A0A0C3G4G9_PILCF|nr:hypothetical protein PILCRDRAFT_1323 [Piloderma croceum F 1598]
MADLAPAIPPVPRPPLNNIINLPPLPENPPVSKNVVEGYRYKEDMAVAHEAGLVSDDHLANAFTYQLNLVQARASTDAAPAWFHVAMQQLLDPIKQRLDRLTALSTQTARLSAVSYNLQAASGTARDFEIVPFRDGSDPTSAPHELCPLLNSAVITALTPQESRDYYRGYYAAGGNLPAMDRRLELIRAAVGCKYT